MIRFWQFVVHFWRFFWAPAGFFVSVIIAIGFFNPRNAIEFTALVFFAALGAAQLTLDYADLKIQGWLAARSRVKRSFVVEYAAMDHSFAVLTLGIVSGLALALGGGVLRRGFEILTSKFFSAIDVPFRSCYAPPTAIIWSATDLNWAAVLLGVGLGLTFGFIMTWNVDSRTFVPAILQTRTRTDTSVVDGFATAFFAGFGLEAGLLFVDGLPLGTTDGVPTQWHPFYLAFITLPIICLTCSLTACGGGLMKDLITNVLLRKGGLWQLLKAWPFVRTTQNAIGIGGFGLIAYFIYYVWAKRFPVAGACLTIDTNVMFYIILASGFVGCATWFTLHGPKQTTR